MCGGSSARYLRALPPRNPGDMGPAVYILMFPYMDRYLWRLMAAAIAMALLLYRLIWDSQ